MNTTERNTVSGTIAWYEDAKSGRGYLRLQFDDGGRKEYQWDQPINAATDSHFVANLFEGYEYTSIDHDGEYIHVAVLN